MGQLNFTTGVAQSSIAYDIHFRSITEARWATLLHFSGVDFDYEPEVYRLSECGYAPDFYLPGYEMFCEVKGKNPTQEEFLKLAELSSITGKPAMFLCGAPQADFPSYGVGFMGAWFVIKNNLRFSLHSAFSGNSRSSFLMSRACRYDDDAGKDFSHKITEDAGPDREIANQSLASEYELNERLDCLLKKVASFGIWDVEPEKSTEEASMNIKIERCLPNNHHAIAQGGFA